MKPRDRVTIAFVLEQDEDGSPPVAVDALQAAETRGEIGWETGHLGSEREREFVAWQAAETEET